MSLWASESTKSSLLNENTAERSYNEQVRSIKNDLVYVQGGLRSVPGRHYPPTPIFDPWLTMTQAVWCVSVIRRVLLDYFIPSPPAPHPIYLVWKHSFDSTVTPLTTSFESAIYFDSGKSRPDNIGYR